MRENEKPVLTTIAQGFLTDLWYIRTIMPAQLFSFSFVFLDVFSLVSNSECMAVSQWDHPQHGAVPV